MTKGALDRLPVNKGDWIIQTTGSNGRPLRIERSERGGRSAGWRRASAVEVAHAEADLTIAHAEALIEDAERRLERVKVDAAKVISRVREEKARLPRPRRRQRLTAQPWLWENFHDLEQFKS